MQREGFGGGFAGFGGAVDKVETKNLHFDKVEILYVSKDNIRHKISKKDGTTLSRRAKTMYTQLTTFFGGLFFGPNPHVTDLAPVTVPTEKQPKFTYHFSRG